MGVSWQSDGLRLVAPSGAASAPVEALIFDLGGTLDADGAGWAQRFRAHWAALGIEPDPAAAAEALEAGERAVLDHPRAATLALAEMVELHARAQLACLGRDDAALHETLADRFTDQTRTCLASRRPLLEALAARLPLAVVSNGCGNARTQLEEVGLARLFRSIVDSSEVGFWKPDPRILEPARAALGVAAPSVAVVGDRVDRDGDAARGAGMLSVWVTGAARPAADDPRLADVDACIASVEALAPEPA